MTHRRSASRPASVALLVLLLAAVALPGCGCCDDPEPPYWGNIYLDNLTHLDIPEFADGFYVAPFGGPFTGNLLPASLAPGATQFCGTFAQDYYDAEAEMEFGPPIVEWFDIFVGDGQDTFFEVY